MNVMYSNEAEAIARAELSAWGVLDYETLCHHDTNYDEIEKRAHHIAREANFRNWRLNRRTKANSAW